MLRKYTLYCKIVAILLFFYIYVSQPFLSLLNLQNSKKLVRRLFKASLKKIVSVKEVKHLLIRTTEANTYSIVQFLLFRLFHFRGYVTR